MFSFCSAPQEGRIAIVTNAGWNAMAATASGCEEQCRAASDGAREQKSRADDTALKASLSGFDGEHAQAVECLGQGCARTVKSRGPDARMLASSLWRGTSQPGGSRKNPHGDGGNRASSHRGEREAAVRTIARGSRSSAEPATHPACVFCTRDRGCQPAPGFPAPSSSREQADRTTSGANAPRERRGVRPRASVHVDEIALGIKRPAISPR